MDFQRDDHLLASHNTSREEDEQNAPSALAREDALPEASEKEHLDSEPGRPEDLLEEHEPGTPVCWPVFQASPGPCSRDLGEPIPGHTTVTPTLIPFPGEEIALLGPMEGEALRLRRMAERRTIFAL
eukprot:3489191-Amphidinium_carterae.1